MGIPFCAVALTSIGTGFFTPLIQDEPSQFAEFRSMPSWTRNGPQAVRHSDRHVVRLSKRFLHSDVLTPHPEPEPESEPGWLGSDAAGPATSEWVTVAESFAIAIFGAGEFGDIPGKTPTVGSFPTSQTSSESALVYLGLDHQTVPLQLGSAGVLEGNDLRYTVRWSKSQRRTNPLTGLIEYRGVVSFTYFVERIEKRLSSATAIDTRRTHGQPNLDGAEPGDPNAPLMEPRFYGWLYRGGMFVGNMPFLSGDQSGLARVQLHTPDGPAPRLAFLSLLDKGARSGVERPPVGLFIPRADDPNLNFPVEELTWSRGWKIHPRQSTQGEPEYDKDPLSVYILNPERDEYANFPLNSKTAGGLHVNPIPPRALTRQCLAIHGEDVAIAQNVVLWRYFAGPAYGTSIPGVTFPDTDSRPRVWALIPVSTHSWQEVVTP
jgi:hypothetical protein